MTKRVDKEVDRIAEVIPGFLGKSSDQGNRSADLAL